MANTQFAVIGIGQFGEAIARTLSKNGAEVMAIDIDEDRIDAISKDVAYAVALDATDKNALLSQDIRNFDAVVIAIGEDLEQLLLCAVNLMDLNVKRIIVRAKNNIARKILLKLGLNEIFSPEIEVGSVVAEKLLHPNIISFLQLPDHYQVAEIKPPAKTIGQTIETLNLRDDFNLSLITIKNKKETVIEDEIRLEEHIMGVPGNKTRIMENNYLVVFGKKEDIGKFIEINS